MVFRVGFCFYPSCDLVSAARKDGCAVIIALMGLAGDLIVYLLFLFVRILRLLRILRSGFLFICLLLVTILLLVFHVHDLFILIKIPCQ